MSTVRVYVNDDWAYENGYRLIAGGDRLPNGLYTMKVYQKSHDVITEGDTIFYVDRCKEEYHLPEELFEI